MTRINCGDINKIDDTDYICGLNIIDFKKALPICISLSIVFLLIQNLVIFSGEPFYVSGMIKINYIANCLATIVTYIFPTTIIAYIIRNYKTHGEEYYKFLYWECFLYRGKKLKIFWDDAKYRKNNNPIIKKSDVISQANHEKMCAKVCIFVMTAFLMFMPLTESVSAEYFDNEKILLSFDKYDYDDITAIYNVNNPSLNNKQKDNSYVAIKFNDGRIFRKYSNEDSITNESFIDTVSKIANIETISCNKLPD